MKKIFWFFFLSSVCLAINDGLHGISIPKRAEQSILDMSGKVKVCQILSVNLSRLGKLNGEEICTGKKVEDDGEGRSPKKKEYNLKISKKLMEKLLGKPFVTGNPCTPNNPDAPPASPLAFKEGVREVLIEICREHWEEEENMHDMKDIIVNSKGLDKLMDSLGDDQSPDLNHRIFECVSRKVHN